MQAIVSVALALACCILANVAIAQQYPTKPVRIVVGFSPGGGTDLLGRLIAQKLSDYWGHPVLVDNRVGAGGTIGADFVAKSAPDGYTILLGSINQNAIAPFTFAKLPYNASADFTPIVNVGHSALVLNVHPSLPVKNVKELIALAKQRPGQITCGSAGGVGTTHHLALEMFMLQTGTKVIHVPYKGSGQLMPELISGQVLMSFDVLPPSMPHIKSGRLHPLAVTTEQRSPKMPQLPTMQEAGVKGFELINWYGLFGPAKLPRDITNRINADVNRALQDAAVAKRIDEAGVEIGGGTADKFDEYVKSEIDKIAKVVKAAGVKPQ
jgi:tripartite-type tricarboxylate transporter receptor subunit TctC